VAAAATVPGGTATTEPAGAATVDEAALQRILDYWRGAVGAFGATLSIRVPGHEDVYLASGIDDRDPDTPMPTDGTYPIGTTGRTFVAAAALQLVAEGLVGLDDPVEAWLPELPNADQITLAMLLDQTSGLSQQDDAADLEVITAELARKFTPEEVLALQVEQPVQAAPGEQFSVISDTGFLAAGLLIERVLGQDLPAVIEERFTAPLGLEDTSIGDGDVDSSRHHWFSIDGNPDRPIDIQDLPNEAYFTFNWANRNFISSSQDMLDWYEALTTGRVLSPEMTAAMFEMRHTVEPRWHQGLGVSGFCLDQAGCEPADVDIIGRQGGGVGIDMMVAHHPASGVTLVMQPNIALDAEGYVTQLIDLAAAVLDELGVT
jgi:D-alanyl-D-alanine carboxypeptidase